jgi:hypothetical protein
VNSSDYVTTAATPDRRLAVSYLPSGGTITVDTTHFAGRVRARWYDPTVGRYAGPGSTAARATRVTLTTPGRNASGDPDWVLVLTAQSVR